MTAETDDLGILGAAQLKGISVLKPVVRHFLLESVHDLLLEHAVVVADSAAVGSIVQSREGIQEAGCETSETAVSEGCVRFLILDGVHLETKFLERIGNRLIGHQVDRVISESASHQELHRKINQFFGILIIKSLLRAHPAVNDLVFQCKRGCLEDYIQHFS